MKTNIGSYDIGARFVGGCLIGLAGLQTGSAWGWVAVVPIVTALAGYCPLYALLHIDTTASDH